MNERPAEYFERASDEPKLIPVTGAEVRKHGICKGIHKPLGYWRLLCGCMKHPAGVSVVMVDGKWYWKHEAAGESQ